MRGDSSTNCSSAFKDFLSLHQLSARSELELMSLEKEGEVLQLIDYEHTNESCAAGRGFRCTESEK